MATSVALTVKDFKSDQEVKWCPGCGDYSILAQIQKTMPEMGIPREKFVVVSGIGCSSRLPYYIDTYGFHGIHGRAPAIATGLKLANPDLDVWVMTGDGDGLSIGGNHFLHTIRRNVGLKIILFDNRIYGLTKGQASPTSEFGKRTKSTPFGSIEQPIHPISVAIGAEVTFIGRCIATDVKTSKQVFERAARHKGTAFVEVYQECKVYNNGAYDYATDRQTHLNNILHLEHGKPMIFGKNSDRGIRLSGTTPEIVQIGEDCSVDDLLVHDERT
ncbi:MAG: 2-oxoacid:ferredoxin oxidoreductase subunit beta, partial [Sedimentisphaerales bacterium]|nr:2-oxoacid:ferredoxin oxidoreductase subunit beta [Sedimentisphaerales bacterium]